MQFSENLGALCPLFLLDLTYDGIWLINNNYNHECHRVLASIGHALSHLILTTACGRYLISVVQRREPRLKEGQCPARGDPDNK